MTCINDVRLVGRLVRDVEVGDGPRPVIRAQVETFRPVKDRTSGETKWLTQTHNVVCLKEKLADVMRKHGKAGRFVKVFGELTYNSRGQAEIIVGFYGDLGMMNSLGGPESLSQKPAQQPVQQQDRTFQDNGSAHGSGPEPSWQGVEKSMDSDGSGADDIPF